MRFPKKRYTTARRSSVPSPEPSPITEVREVREVRNMPDQTPAPASDLPEELIAQRAYELWKRRGCPMGQDSERDWYAARAELEQERLGWTQPQPADRNKI
jgi:Protein of unknown function (DUF2934)